MSCCRSIRTDHLMKSFKRVKEVKNMNSKNSLTKKVSGKISIVLSGLALLVASAAAGCGTCQTGYYPVLFGCVKNECESDYDCKNKGNGKYCESNSCISCRTNSECNLGYECKFGDCSYEKQEHFGMSDFKP